MRVLMKLDKETKNYVKYTSATQGWIADVYVPKSEAPGEPGGRPEAATVELTFGGQR
jgi:hypothetical protein